MQLNLNRLERRFDFVCCFALGVNQTGVFGPERYFLFNNINLISIEKINLQVIKTTSSQMYWHHSSIGLGIAEEEWVRQSG